MLEAPESIDVAELPLAPKNPLRYRHQLRALRSLIDGHQELLDAGGPVTRVVLGPKWLFPAAVLWERNKSAGVKRSATQYWARGLSNLKGLSMGAGPRPRATD